MCSLLTRWKWLAGSVLLLGLVFLCFGAAHAGEEEGATVALPDASAKAISEACPGAEIDEVEIEHERGMKLYEVELEQDGEELEVTVSADGVIAEVEREVTSAELPRAVAAAIAKAAEGARIVELEKEEVHAVLKLVKLEEPLVRYEAEFVKDGKEYEIELAADGTVIGQEEDEDDEHHDDDE